MSSCPTICIVDTGIASHLTSQAHTLSESLAIPVCRSFTNDFDYYLVYTAEGLELQHNPQNHKCKQMPVSVDFLKKREIITRIRTSTIKDPLCRAVGIKSGYRPYIADATAGLGLDGLTLAWLGCKIVMIERSPIIYALLDDGLKRAAASPLLREVINGNIVLRAGNAVDVFAGLPRSPDTILLDPMYPQEKRRSLNKISMRILRDLVGDDDDCEELFRASLATAQNRVAVKRPKGVAAIVASPLPNHRIDMKSGHFDVYLKNNLTIQR